MPLPIDQTPRGLHFRVRRERKLLKVVLAIILCFVMLGGFIGWSVFRLQANIQTEPLNLGTSKVHKNAGPPIDVAVDPMNILILGTDTRTDNSDYGTEDDSSGYGSSDVMLLLHLYVDKKSATIVSFPRDLMTPLPSCENPDTGEVSMAQTVGQLNSALKEDGPGCTVAAISDVTGLQIDHMMLADFNAVKELSNTIGGVEVCVTQPVDDEKSGLKIPAGVSEVQGEQALAFLRTRSAFGDGSDLGRIRAQQSFLASLARKVTSTDTLSNIPKVYAIADTITKNLTIDEDLNSIPELLKIADRMKNLDMGNIQFITAPNEPYIADPNRVQLIENEAASIFDSLAKDTLVNKETTVPTIEIPLLDATLPLVPSTPATPIPTPEDTLEPLSPIEELPAVDPSLLTVDVINNSGKADRESEVATTLKAIGYMANIADIGNELPSTQIFYAYGDKENALQVAKSLGVSPAQVQHSLDVVAVTVAVGKDFMTDDKLQAASTLDPSLQGQTAADVTCNVS